jgi:chromosome segregation ATPase
MFSTISGLHCNTADRQLYFVNRRAEAVWRFRETAMNPIFTAAIDALQQADVELRRLASTVDQATTAATGAEQRLAQLRKNENDLNATLAVLAQQVATARQTIANAPSVLAAAMTDGQARANELIIQATTNAQIIVQEAEVRAAAKLADAQATVDGMAQTRAAAQAQLSDVQAQLETAQNGFSALKKQAADFAGR